MSVQVRGRSVSCESGRWREQSAAARIQRKQELGEGVGWLLKWRAWRHGGWADVALQTAVLTSWWLLSNILFSIFLFFPFMTRLMVHSFSCWWDFQISTETISTVENTNQNYVGDGVVTTEGNADGNFTNWPLHSTYRYWWWKRNTNANKQSAAFGRLM